MPKVKIKNGFRNIGGQGILLTGDLISGEINSGDYLLVGLKKVQISEVELKEYKDSKYPTVILTVADKNDIKWFKMYNKTYKILKPHFE